MYFKKNLFPLLILFVVVLILSFSNIKPGTYFSGWDNSHPEFNLLTFTKRIISGAWVEFQGTGAPASQSQLAEIPRLPLIYLLKLILPNNLIRYVFTFVMVLIGGLGMYCYIEKFWFTDIPEKLNKILSLLAGIFYILNIISLQQFFINFEMYSVEFAFFPWVLISLHLLVKNMNKKNLILLVLFQLLFAPTGFVPTVFYFAYFFWLVYFFFLNLEFNNFFKTVKKTLVIFLLIFFINAFWIIPNLYYVVNNSHYVQESRGNQLFNMEAISSVKEAASLYNFLTGIHYLFTWKDFNFSEKQYEPIFKPWINHLTQPIVTFFLIICQVFNFAGFFYILFNKKKGVKKIGIIFIYSIISIFIWMGLFLPENIINFIYKFGAVKEAFRNPFTKLSNYYSFFITILIFSTIESIIIQLLKIKHKFLSHLTINILLIFFVILFSYSFVPSFKGYFINPKLKVSFPQEYFELFSFLNKMPKNFRILELPFYSYAGWLYYDWQHLKKDNGYQGMGFYLFGMNQSLITPDHARWTEATDFLYHELKYALNSNNHELFQNLLNKYLVNLIIVDETSKWANLYYDHQKIYQLINKLNYPLIWKKNFLRVYQVIPKLNISLSDSGIIIPKKINFAHGIIDRVQKDIIYELRGDYINKRIDQSDYIFPFSDLYQLKINNIEFRKNGISVSKEIALNKNYNYLVKIPTNKDEIFQTFTKFIYNDGVINIIFPKITLKISNKEYLINNNYEIKLDTKKSSESIIVGVNEKLFEINNNDEFFLVLDLYQNKKNIIYYLPKKQAPSFADQNLTNNYLAFEINKDSFKDEILLDKKKSHKLTLSIDFPFIQANLLSAKPINCSNPLTGEIKTFFNEKGVVYEASNFGVNCDHFSFENVDFTYPFLINITGENFEGRSLKFFIDYRTKNYLIEEFMMPKEKYSETLVLLPVEKISRKTIAINWETRSYGKKSKNALNDLKLFPFPLEKIAPVQIQKLESNNFNFKNDLETIYQKKFLTFLYFLKIKCRSEICFFGINQSYDSLWLAIDSKFKLLNHFKYNNWANIWQINNNNKDTNWVLVIYLPQVISYISLFALIMFIIKLLRN